MLDRYIEKNEYGSIFSMIAQLQQNLDLNEDRVLVDESLELLDYISNEKNREQVIKSFYNIEQKSDYSYEFAMINKLIGALYANGCHYNKDIDKAVELLESDGLKEDPQAWFLLGNMFYKEGRLEEGFEYLSKASLVGNTHAKSIVDELISKGVGKDRGFFETIGLSDKDIEEARKNLE